VLREQALFLRDHNCGGIGQSDVAEHRLGDLRPGRGGKELEGCRRATSGTGVQAPAITAAPNTRW
jgi:hypothetical protein